MVQPASAASMSRSSPGPWGKTAKASSTPSKASGPSGFTGKLCPRNSTVGRALARLAMGTNEEIARFARSKVRSSSSPIAPVAPTTAI
jgi:hypothetical protein